VEEHVNTHYLEQSGGRIAYEDNGQGPLVICAPSMGDLRAEYRFLAPELVSAGYRVVSMDVRGHGETGITWSDFSVAAIGADLLALIRRLDAGPAIIIGTSMAAGAAVWAAAETPELVDGLVLIDPFVRGEGTWQSRLLYRVLFADLWGPFVWKRYYASLYPTRKPADFTEYAALLLANLHEPGRMQALRQMMLASKAASEQRLSRVKAPAVVIMGSKDPDFKNPEAEAGWVAGCLHTHYEMIKDAGHYPHAEMPEVTGKLIESFLMKIREDGELAHITTRG
jgi:pimeloyl-ACP methyl ester carboxylesterase